jgi:hypothetical protein
VSQDYASMQEHNENKLHLALEEFSKERYSEVRETLDLPLCKAMCSVNAEVSAAVSQTGYP